MLSSMKVLPVVFGASTIVAGSVGYACHKRKSPPISLKPSDTIVDKAGSIDSDGNRLVCSRGKQVHILEDSGVWSMIDSKYAGSNSISADGVTLVIGCPDAPKGKRHGRVMIYRKKKDTWSLFDELFPSHGEKDGCFGRVVKLKNDKLLVAGDTCWAVYKESNGRFYQVKYMFADLPYELAFPGLAVCKNSIVDVRGKTLYEYEDFKGPRCIINHDHSSSLILGWDVERKVIAGNQTFIEKDQAGFGQSLSLHENQLFVLSDNYIFVYSYLDEWQKVSFVTIPKFAALDSGKMMWTSKNILFLSCPSIDLIYTWNISIL